MAESRGRYPPEYREQMVELVRSGRSVRSLARKFEPSEQTIRNWVRQADLGEGRRSDGLTTEARLELLRLKWENKRLRMERNIPKKSRIEAVWRDSRETYGRPRIHAALRARGERVGQKRVARLMKRADIRRVTRRRWTTATTRRDSRARPAVDLVNRDFSAEGPNQLWVADITYVPTWAGWLYLAVVLDA